MADWPRVGYHHSDGETKVVEAFESQDVASLATMIQVSGLDRCLEDPGASESWKEADEALADGRHKGNTRVESCSKAGNCSDNKDWWMSESAPIQRSIWNSD